MKQLILFSLVLLSACSQKTIHGIKFRTTGFDTVMAQMDRVYGGTREHMPVFLVAEDGDIVQCLDYWGRPFIVSKHDKVTIAPASHPERPHPIKYVDLPITPYYIDSSKSVANVWYRIAIGYEGNWVENGNFLKVDSSQHK